MIYNTIEVPKTNKFSSRSLNNIKAIHMKQFFLTIAMMVSISAFATEGYSPYFATQYHHQLSDVKNDLDDGCSWKIFCNHHAIGWNRTLLSVAKHFGGGESDDGNGVIFTFNGKDINLAYINGDDFESIIMSSKIVSTNLKVVKTSARVTWSPGYEYYTRKIRVVDGVTEKFFAKSLGDYYGNPDLVSILILHTGDICGNPMEEFMISSQQNVTTNVEEEPRPRRREVETPVTEKGVTIVNNNYNTNNNNSSSNQSQTQGQSSTNLNGQPGQQGASYNAMPYYYEQPQAGQYGYGSGVGTGGYGMGCDNNRNYDNRDYDRGYRPRTDNGWGNYGNNHNNRDNRDHTMRNNTVRNYGGPRGHDYNPGNNGGVRNYGGPRGNDYNSGSTGNNGGPRNHSGGGGTTGNGGGHRFNRGGQ